MNLRSLPLLICVALACNVLTHGTVAADDAPFVVVLGTAQDAGFPQAGCKKDCCAKAWNAPSVRRFATSLAVVDPKTRQRWLFDCSPDFREQLRLLDTESGEIAGEPLNGIFLTHAHVGHYAGMIHLGREVMGARAVPVHAMPRMRTFLTNNGPWSQLVSLKNIELRPLKDQALVRLNDRLTVTPLMVPHRDEFSETVGFIIAGPSRSVLYLPDIDKWSKWKMPIESVLAKVDIAYLDGTFYANGEIPGRDMSQIPHPFVEESLSRLAKLPAAERAKVRFIHLNHTNPALHPDSAATRTIRSAGSNLAKQGEKQKL